MHDVLTGEAFEQAVAISSCCIVSLEKGLKGMCAPSKYYSYLQGGKAVLAVVEEGSYLEEEIERESIGQAVRIGDVDGLVSKVINMQQCSESTQEMQIRAGRLYDQAYRLDKGLGRYRNLFQNLLMGS